MSDKIQKNVIMQMDMDEVRKAIAESSPNTRIYVGADSKRVKKKVVYVTVVILHYEGKHGGRVFKNIVIEPWYGNIKQRLMNEVYGAIGVAFDIVDHLGGRPFEIHLDLNTDPKHKSNMCVKEAVGYVLGSFGFKPKLKPEAWAASTVADDTTVKLRKRVQHMKQNEVAA